MLTLHKWGRKLTTLISSRCKRTLTARILWFNLLAQMFSHRTNHRCRSLLGYSLLIVEIISRLKLHLLDLNPLTFHPPPSQELESIKSSQIKLTRSIHNKIHLLWRNNCSYKICKWASLKQQASRSFLKRETGVGVLLAVIQTKIRPQWPQIYLLPFNRCQAAPQLQKFKAVLQLCLKQDKNLLDRASLVQMTHHFPPKPWELSLLKTSTPPFSKERTQISKETPKHWWIQVK